MNPKEVLKDVFGYSEFRGNQEKVINSVLESKDSLVLMPTGGGKSLCYQIPSIVKKGVGIVISPLIALMQDQVNALKLLGVKAEALNSNLDFNSKIDIINQARSGELDILYLSPEKLCSEEFIYDLQGIDIALFAVDEAHCVSQWGHDFRPEYTLLNNIFNQFGDVPKIALTATADEATRKDIVKNLNLEKAKIFISGFDRPNIEYNVTLKNNQNKQLLTFLVEQGRFDSGIIYCGTRKKVDKTYELLKAKNYNVLPYHAGLNANVRQKNQEKFQNEEGAIMVATIAFGMGIDKSNVRFVVHLDLPKSMEAYYQETGRAGRDGLPSKVLMLYGLQDLIIQKRLIQESLAKDEIKYIELRKLNSLLGFCESVKCRRQVILGYFGETYEENCDNCDNCLKEQEAWEGLYEAQLALSCVYRTRQIFGVSYLVSVLRGEGNERVTNFNHDKLEVFGKGAHKSSKVWQSVFRQLIAYDYLKVDIEGYGSLMLTESARSILKGEQEIYFRLDPEVKTKTQRKAKDKKLSVVLDQGLEEELFLELKKLRLKIAKEQSVPPYIVFSDKTLVEMAKFKPGDLSAMSAIYGVGESKLARYGDIFLEKIQNYSSANSQSNEQAF